MAKPQLDVTERFTERVDDYDRYRPSYPAQTLELLRVEIGLQRSWRIADLGSGTGISADIFLKNGNEVFGVEPNRPMREAAERRLQQYANFTSVTGAAEATTLPTHSVDMIIAAQAFHWFDVPRTRVESLRIVKPGGSAVIMWNTRRLDATPFLRGYEQLLVEHGVDYQLVRHDRLDRAKLDEFFGGPFTTTTIPSQQLLDANGLRGRLQSSSYVPAVGAAGHVQFDTAVNRLFNDHQQDGVVTIQYNTELHFRAIERSN